MSPYFIWRSRERLALSQQERKGRGGTQGHHQPTFHHPYAVCLDEDGGEGRTPGGVGGPSIPHGRCTSAAACSGLLEGRLSCATCSRVRKGQFSSVHYVMQHLPCDRGSALRGAHAAPPPAFRARVRDTGRRWPAIRQCSWQPWRMEYTSISAARQAEQLRQRLPNYPFMHSGSRAQAH